MKYLFSLCLLFSMSSIVFAQEVQENEELQGNQGQGSCPHPRVSNGERRSAKLDSLEKDIALPEIKSRKN